MSLERLMNFHLISCAQRVTIPTFFMKPSKSYVQQVWNEKGSVKVFSKLFQPRIYHAREVIKLMSFTEGLHFQGTMTLLLPLANANNYIVLASGMC